MEDGGGKAVVKDFICTPLEKDVNGHEYTIYYISKWKGQIKKLCKWFARTFLGDRKNSYVGFV